MDNTLRNYLMKKAAAHEARVKRHESGLPDESGMEELECPLSSMACVFKRPVSFRAL